MGKEKEEEKKPEEQQGKEDDKSQENERLLPKVEEEETAVKEVKKDEGKTNEKDGNQDKNGGEAKELGEKLEPTAAKPTASPLSLPEEVVLKVFMHCEGCAKKVRKSLKDLEGVEDVKTDRKKSTVVVKGKKVAQDPKKVAETIYRKSGKRVEILSPAPAPVLPKNVAIIQTPEKKKEVQTEEMVAVLKVYMHCEACAEEIKRRILKLSGVQGVETNLGTSQVKVNGNFDPNNLVKYIYKRTGKHAFIVKQEQTPASEKIAPTGNAEVGNNSKPETEKENEIKEEKTEEKPKEELVKDESSSSKATVVAVAGPGDSAVGKRDHHNYYYFPRYPMEYAYPYQYPYPYPYQYQYQYPPPPQIFSDENPNACNII
ncbi:Heavy metal transport/detoxification superfamily protein [Rhynchospora pubera]|uniref:Heavy metal transport/detoxification superfamily protein n=1 Tax=Rhynchospora pubera TaxID=906938 RepID=A0AAV8FXL3_9POAL|nr:Heavy metal transport/detoxification superfamily protein [Rhynchospora pubera]